jgi:cobalt-zinc-cadmium efflux system protein
MSEHPSHSHAHRPQSFGRAFAIGIGLNTAFVLLEVIFGFISNSVALLADAGHNLSDVLGLVVAWIAALLSKRPPTERYTYGLRGTSILAALSNAALLFVAVGAIAWESIHRLFQPEPAASNVIMAVAAIGVIINGLTAWLFASGRKTDLNIRGAYLHMASDAAVSAGVVLAGLAIWLTSWYWLDPVTSLIIVAVILWGTWGLFRNSLAMSLSAVPPDIKLAEVQSFLAGRKGVTQVHDLHIWPMSTTETALTAHLVIPSGHPGDEFVQLLARELHDRYGIEHVTLQIERSAACPLAPRHVV